MPWNKSVYPDAFNNLTAKQREKAISVAEAIRKQCVKDGGNEKECAAKAIKIALNRIKKGSETMNNRVLAEPTHLSEIKKNFDNKVRGIDIVIDVNHDRNSKAAGWIKGLEIDQSSTVDSKQALFAIPEWTDYGKELIKNGEYRYISSEFGPYEDAESRKKFNDVLFAVTLTNRPFVKGMGVVDLAAEKIEILREGDYLHPQYGELAIKATEPEKIGVLHKAWEALTAYFVESDLPTNTKTDDTVPPKRTNKQTGAEASTRKEVNMDAMKEKQLIDLLTAHGVEASEDSDVIALLTDYLAGVDEKVSDLEEKLAGDPETLDESEEDKAKLVEAETEKTRLEEVNTKLSERVTALEQTLKDKERDVFFSEKMTEGKLRPADLDSYKKLYEADPETTKSLLDKGPTVVDLEEHGSSSDKVEDEDDALLGRVTKLSEEKNISREAALDLLADMESDE